MLPRARTRLLAIAAVFASLGASGTASAQRTYRNPFEDVHVGDPFIYRVGQTYYLYGTADDAADIQGIPLWTSRDLVHWERRGFAFRREDGKYGDHGFWAPELFKHGDKYYLHFSAHRDREPVKVVLAEGDSPAGPFRETKGPWFKTDKATIDSHVFRDADGRLYLFVVHLDQGEDRHFEIHVRELDPLTLDAREPSKEILRPSQPWETVRVRNERGEEQSLVTEAPFVVRRGDTYFLTYSANPWFADTYGVGVATAPGVLGPWTKSPANPLLQARGVIRRPGHQCLIDSPDGTRWFIAYHVVTDPAQPSGRRRRAIDRVRFGAEGSPTIAVDGPTETDQPYPLDQPADR
jgi:beta-xylosidase